MIALDKQYDRTSEFTELEVSAFDFALIDVESSAIILGNDDLGPEMVLNAPMFQVRVSLKDIEPIVYGNRSDCEAVKQALINLAENLEPAVDED